MLNEYVRELQRAIINMSAQIDDLEARMERLERLTGHYADEDEDDDVGIRDALIASGDTSSLYESGESPDPF